MLINLSNHPSTRWSATQMNAAKEAYGSVQDMPFPNIPPAATTAQIQQMARGYVQQIRELAKEEAHLPFAAHVMGEMTFMYRVVKLLRRSGILCLASTTERNTIEHEDGSKTFLFDFIQFRPYD